MSYSIYEHVFPDGKRYIGISNDPIKRWKSDGSGYISNQPMWKAIQKYGWDNIRHNIIEDNLSRKEAQEKEKELIKDYDTIRKGYNQRPGGTLSVSYYNKHVTKMISCLEKYKFMKKDFSPTAKRLRELADDECWACELNYVDSMIRNETDGFIHGLAYVMGDNMYEVMDWYFYLSQYVSHPEVDFRKIENQMAKNILNGGSINV